METFRGLVEELTDADRELALVFWATVVPEHCERRGCREEIGTGEDGCTGAFEGSGIIAGVEDANAR